jgi:Late competence development protein ComFB
MSFSSETYTNAMELLVFEEIKQQIERCEHPLKEYINLIEVATYALNRLPPLYASSEEGLYRQRLKAEKEYKNKISEVVHQALKVVQQEPIRFSTPLSAEPEMERKLQPLEMDMEFEPLDMLMFS